MLDRLMEDRRRIAFIEDYVAQRSELGFDLLAGLARIAGADKPVPVNDFTAEFRTRSTGERIVRLLYKEERLIMKQRIFEDERFAEVFIMPGKEDEVQGILDEFELLAEEAEEAYRNRGNEAQDEKNIMEDGSQEEQS